ncbi:MAG: hypothetical protein OI74_12005 [Gammaproteobacteria bacterium (ex Lamellibrachia satsuma)]|nr:MAG: hypothetical protein HPY30_09055 [Gammaproteobacteria bacterium (ex Lamellibrachia satsuma)]RRS32062.1 MAG: hypothetical protein OI74_12005 [Gammaproteobacteria bacterium (ex Lamellibrachia satsuma)]RRS34343.1 MAG: hypothetical protein NV67_13765 [Gammaproteobacteria bacterium (ex Lamellibrachia satsuma)]
MDNRISARITFSFKGETHTPSASVDLDELIKRGDSHDTLHPLLARTNGIDSYSYLYEVMESHPIEFSNPTGFAADYLSGTEFDFVGFEKRWHEEKYLSILDAIIQHHFKGEDCAQHPSLKAALREAFHAGKAAASRE